MTWFLRIVSFVALIAWSYAAPVQAELYVGGQFGISLPQGLSNVEGVGGGFGGAGFKGTDLDQTTSFLYGAKVGYFFPRMEWLGVEGEVYVTNPHLEQQTLTITGPGGFSVPTQRLGAHMRMINGAFNLIARYPGRRFQPYVGGGIGLYQAQISGSQQFLNRPLEASDFSPGYNVLAGARYFLSRQIALFSEWKYNRTSFTFEENAQFKADYSAHNFAVGVSYHFRK